MTKIDLTQYGITDVKEIVYNPSFDALYEEEINPALEGYDRGQVSELGAVNVMTGIYTGRSPKDKYSSAGTFRQEAVCDGCILRRQQGYPYGDPFYYGGCMAGSFCKEYVHPSHRRGAGEL